MSTAIDDLRSMLDERHVKWRTDTSVTNKVEWTIWKSPWFKEVWAKEVDGSISIFNCSMTPAQAIEATLGRGECRDSNNRFNAWQCSECGAAVLLVFDDFDEPTYSVNGSADVPNFCPNCGKVVRA